MNTYEYDYEKLEKLLDITGQAAARSGMSYQEVVDALSNLTYSFNNEACYLDKINKLEQNAKNLLAQTANVNTEISNKKSDLEIIEEKPRYEVKPMVNLYEEYGIERLVVPWEENH